jgi:hypothetical protein
MAPLDNAVVLIASLLVGGVGIHLGARLLVSAHDYSGSEAKAHGFSRGMKPTTGNQTTGDARPNIPTF